VFIESGGVVALRGRFSVNCSQKVSFWTSSLIVGLFEVVFVIGVFLPENAPVFSWKNVEMIFAIPALIAILFALTYQWQKSTIEGDRESVLRRLREALRT
jgi:hypothetical protein